MWKYIKSILVVALVLGGLVAVASLYDPATVCDRTFTYGLGGFDSRFGISREALLETLLQAEAVWEKPMGLNLFTYDPQAGFTVNLIYDERQEQTAAERELREKLDSSGASYESLVREHTSLLKEYESGRAQFQARLEAYNSQASSWNSRGGAPKKELAELEAERRYLQTEQDRLNEMASRLNALAEHITEIARKHNLNVSVYNQRFSIAREFDQADFRSGEAINVYQFGGQDELRLALAHEFGHALDLDHLENPEAIMYYLMEKQDQKDPELTADDIRALQLKCRLTK